MSWWRDQSSAKQFFFCLICGASLSSLFLFLSSFLKSFLSSLPPPLPLPPIILSVPPHSTVIRTSATDLYMDPSTPAPAQTNAAASSSSDQPPRNKGRRGGAAKGQSDSSSKASKGSSAEKGSKDNHHHQNTRKKDKAESTSSGSNAQQRAPKTIAATDPIDLQAGKTIVAPPVATTAEEPVDDEDKPQCFICTDDIVIFAVSDCNHRTCHLCSLRLRALYKTKNCAYCKVCYLIR